MVWNGAKGIVHARADGRVGRDDGVAAWIRGPGGWEVSWLVMFWAIEVVGWSGNVMFGVGC
jgi:hypothetical protein